MIISVQEMARWCVMATDKLTALDFPLREATMPPHHSFMSCA